jgi:hypothetical protein
MFSVAVGLGGLGCSPGRVSTEPVPSIAAEGRPALRFDGNRLEVYDGAGVLRDWLTTERNIDNVLDFTDSLVLYKMATPEGWPDGALRLAYFDGSAAPDPSLTARVRSARIHADGRTVALVTWAGELYLWDMVTNALNGPIFAGVLPFAAHFEPGGGYRLLVGVETNAEPEMVDAWLYDVTSGVVTPLPTAGHALRPRWSEPGVIVYGTDGADGRAWQMDVSSGVEVEVEPAVHAAAQFEAVNVRPGLPPGNRSDLVTMALTVAELNLKLPYPAGVSRDIWQAYDGDPGNSLGSHTGDNRYAIDFGPSWSEPSCGKGSAVLAIADGVATIAGSTGSGCADNNSCDGSCSGCSGGGLRVIITHLGDFVSTYMHNSAVHVNDGDPVCQGLLISDMGNSGFACGCCASDADANGTHIHLRLMNAAGEPVVPEPLSGYTGIDTSDPALVSDNVMRLTCEGAPPPYMPPPGTTPPACPGGDGPYCGGSVGLTENLLYWCSGGSYTVQEVCGWGCHVSAVGTADYCEPAPPSMPGMCPSGDGAYCGESVGLTPGTLYSCVAGTFTPQQVCTGGCVVAPPGTADYCGSAPPPTSCPSGDGWYCGETVGMTGGTLYYCVGGSYSVDQVCAYGCVVAPSGTADYCGSMPPPPSSCPSGDGWYCGETVGMTAGTLYHCVGGSYSVDQVCAYGCVVAPPGVADYCASAPPPSSCPSGDGYYCGQSVGLTGGTLYYCTGGSYSAVSVCPAGCVVAPPGVADYCA